jgi:hypothetical protein
VDKLTKRKSSWSPGLSGTGPGTVCQCKQGHGRKRRKGRKERKERGGKERDYCVERSGTATLMMDGSMDTDESKTSSRGREGWGEGKMRRGKGTKESDGQQWL